MLVRLSRTKIVETNFITAIVTDGEKFMVFTTGSNEIQLNTDEGNFLLSKLTIEENV